MVLGRSCGAVSGLVAFFFRGGGELLGWCGVFGSVVGFWWWDGGVMLLGRCWDAAGTLLGRCCDGGVTVV